MRALVFETMTGNPVIEVEITDWKYDTGILAADALSVTVPAYTPRSQQMDLRALLMPRKHGIALIDETVRGETLVPAAGYIASVEATESADGKNTYQVSCQGIEKILENRNIRKFPGWPLVNESGAPASTYNLSFKNLEYGTIMKKLIQESMRWVGGSLPIVFEPDRTGTRTRTYEALDGKPVLEAINDLTEIAGGVEYDFQPVLDAQNRISFKFHTGTDRRRVITGNSTPVINVGGAKPDITGWRREPSMESHATASVFTGGKGSMNGDRILVARAENLSLTLAGFPFSEVWDTSHTSVSNEKTLQTWAQGAIRNVVEKVSFSIRYEKARTLRHGDLVTMDSLHHWDMPNGRFQRRVMSIARSSGTPDWLDIELVGVVK